MGVTTNLYLIKDSFKRSKSNFEILLAELKIKSKVEKKDISYEQLLTEIWNRNPFPLIGIAYHNHNFIIQDNYSLIDQTVFEYFTNAFQTSILQVDHSDTVEISSFSYYENGKCLRRKSLGNDYWAKEIQELGIEVPEGAVVGDYDEGEPLEFERNGSDSFTVMETYGIAFDILSILKWELRFVEQ